MPYEYGQIVLVPMADGRGDIKLRPAVILSPSEQILPEAELRVVCVSTQVETHARPTTYRSRGSGRVIPRLV